MNETFKKLEKIKQSLDEKFLERDKEIEGILLALLSKQHILLIGPAGTAKSALTAELATILKGTNYFHMLLTPFSTPEEIFGPLSLKDLAEGHYRRNTVFKMPEADIVFLDEIFKANSAILNSILTLINERLYFNDESPITVPLISVIGASNELPEDDDGLEALSDRFLLRYEVKYIQSEHNFLSMLKQEPIQSEIPSIQLGDLIKLQKLVNEVTVSDSIYEALLKIRIALQDEGIHPSDRRFKQSLNVLKAKAFLQGRRNVQLEDLSILKHILWEKFTEQETVCRTIIHYTENYCGCSLETIKYEAEEIYDIAVRDSSIEAGMEAIKKLSSLQKNLESLKTHDNAILTEINILLERTTSMKTEIETNRLDLS